MGLVSIWTRGSIGSDLTCRKLCPKEYYSPAETAFSSSISHLNVSSQCGIDLSPYLTLSAIWHNTWTFLSLDKLFCLQGTVISCHFFRRPKHDGDTLSASVAWQIKDYLPTILNIFSGSFLDFITTHDWLCFSTCSNQRCRGWQETKCLSSQDLVNFSCSWQAR